MTDTYSVNHSFDLGWDQRRLVMIFMVKLLCAIGKALFMFFADSAGCMGLPLG